MNVKNNNKNKNKNSIFFFGKISHVGLNINLTFNYCYGMFRITKYMLNKSLDTMVIFHLLSLFFQSCLSICQDTKVFFFFREKQQTRKVKQWNFSNKIDFPGAHIYIKLTDVHNIINTVWTPMLSKRLSVQKNLSYGLVFQIIQWKVSRREPT